MISRYHRVFALFFSFAITPYCITHADATHTAQIKKGNPENIFIRLLNNTAQAISNIFSSIIKLLGQLGRRILSFFGWRPSLDLVTQLENTTQQRQEQFEQQHTAAGISPRVAKIASVINRMEDDVTQLRNARTQTDDTTYIQAYTQAIERIDDEVDVYMDTVQEDLYQAQDEAFAQKNIAEFAFIQRLLSSEFLLDMLD